MKLPTSGKDPRLENMRSQHERKMRAAVKDIHVLGKVRLPRKRKKTIHRIERWNYEVLLTAVMLHLDGRRTP